MAIRQPLRSIGRELKHVVRATTPARLHLRERVIGITALTVLIDAVASVAVYFLERHARGTAIHTVGDAVFWTSAQLTTVSSQMPNPLSTGGRILDIALEIYAITVVATLAGSFSAFFHHRSLERKAAVDSSQSEGGAG